MLSKSTFGSEEKIFPQQPFELYARRKLFKLSRLFHAWKNAADASRACKGFGNEKFREWNYILPLQRSVFLQVQCNVANNLIHVTS